MVRSSFNAFFSAASTITIDATPREATSRDPVQPTHCQSEGRLSQLSSAWHQNKPQLLTHLPTPSPRFPLQYWQHAPSAFAMRWQAMSTVRLTTAVKPQIAATSFVHRASSRCGDTRCTTSEATSAAWLFLLTTAGTGKGINASPRPIQNTKYKVRRTERGRCLRTPHPSSVRLRPPTSHWRHQSSARWLAPTHQRCRCRRPAVPQT